MVRVTDKKGTPTMGDHDRVYGFRGPSLGAMERHDSSLPALPYRAFGPRILR